jgi:tripartite-type tricarboxylate transporter receptor subunit TctC
MKRSFAGWMLCAALSVSGAGAWAQDYPIRPIRLVLGFPSGGTPDALARSVAAQLETQIGRNIVVDNRTGANGIIAAEIVATAPPDGYTMLFAPPALIINQILQPRLPYDVFRDFTAVTAVCLGTGYLLVVHPSVPARSVRELIALAKNPQKPLTYGTPGIGNTQHLVGELFNLRAQTRLLHVPYKGLTPAINALLGGEINLLFVPPTVMLPHVKAGRLRALGFTGTSRWEYLPDLPAVSETVPGFTASGAWMGWFAPARTPRRIVARLHAEVQKALQVPKVRDFILTGGYVPDGRSPDAFLELVRADMKKYGDVVRAAGIKAE